jgi:quercetin dioxygenase-like cupin family protein
VTHHVGSLASTPPEAGTYAGHSSGYERRVLFGPATGSAHQEAAIGELAAGGSVARHLHAFEQALYLLEGSVTLDVAGSTEQLVADDYVFVGRGVAHAVRNEGDAPARWFVVSAPQPGAELDDTVFVEGTDPEADADPAYVRGHFDVADLPEPTKTGIDLAGFSAANVGGAALKVLVGPDTGASQLILMCIQYVPGGFIGPHDHAFEEGFFFLEGEIEAELSGEVRTLRAGDYFWTGTSSMHGLKNTSDGPTRWLETQVPQPPSRYQARFAADWRRFVSGD